MAARITTVDIDDMPELARLAKEVATTRTAKRLRLGRDVVAEITPVAERPSSVLNQAKESPSARRRRKSGLVGPDDPIWGLIGIGRGAASGAGSEDKHQALGEAHQKHLGR